MNRPIPPPPARAASFDDHHLYEDLSRLNNELATLQRELAKKNFELARFNEQKNQFLGIAAHDLRNPLEVIMTYSQFLLDDEREVLDDEQRGFVDTIRSSSTYMLGLVNDFLDYSKIEAGRLVLETEWTDITRCVANAVMLNRPIAAKKSIEIRFQPEFDLPALRIDEAKFEQVLHNLIGNAIKFSHPGGEIRVTAKAEAEAVVIAVEDKGVGFDEIDADDLFRPYQRGRSRATAGEKSTGLGLAIVKKIVEAHGGTITAEGATGAGARFCVKIPTVSGSNDRRRSGGYDR